MSYLYSEADSSNDHLKGRQFIHSKADNTNVPLEKFTSYNASSLTVKLGIKKAYLDNYIDSMEFVTI